MRTQDSSGEPPQAARGAVPVTGSRVRQVVVRTVSKSWGDGIFAVAAQAAYWQTLSLPPLLLGLLGSTGYVAGWFGPRTR